MLVEELQTGKAEQLADKTVNLPGCLLGEQQIVGIGSADPEPLCFEVATECEQWCAQVVRDSADQESTFAIDVGFARACFVQSCAHAGYGLSDIGDFTQAGVPALRQRVTSGDAVDVLAQVAKGPY